MKNILEKIFHSQNDKMLCIDENICNFNKIPNLINEYIIKAVHKSEKVIVITNNLEYNKITDVFLNIKLYEKSSINIDEFIELVNKNDNKKQTIRVIWDFNNISKDRHNINIINQYIDNILRSLNRNNIIHMFYINSLNHKEKELLKVVKNFQSLLVINSEKELYFEGKSEIQNIISLIQCNKYNKNKYLSLENELIKMEKLKLMIETTAGIAHDMNNILTPAIGTVQLLKDMNIEDENILKCIRTLEMCIYDGISITNKMKTMTKIEDGISEKTIFNVDDLIIDSINLTKNKWLTENTLNGIKTKVYTKLDSRALVKGNVTEIREVFINLIRNAIDALQSGGNINISTNRVDNNVKIEICDNGIGMTKEVLEKIFDTFFTTKGDDGSGLGLPISRNIVIAHGGTMSVESEVNVGTKISVMLPICNTKEYNIKKVNITHKINFSGDILIIDDTYEIRNVLSDMIKSMTKSKIKKCDSENLLLELKRRKYNIVICDLCMPKIDGLEVAKLVKKQNEKCYFCLMTGWMGHVNQNECIDFILNKPINKEKIIDMFTNYNKRIG